MITKVNLEKNRPFLYYPRMASSVLPQLPHAAEPGEAVIGANPAFLCIEAVRDEPSRPMRGVCFGLVLSAGMWAGIGLLVALVRR
jgi:hypothetical protein